MSRRTTETTNHKILNVSNMRIVGNHNVINGGNNEIVGNHNIINGSNNSINGNHNIINGKAKSIKGSFNTNNSTSVCTTVIGSHNSTRKPAKQSRVQSSSSSGGYSANTGIIGNGNIGNIISNAIRRIPSETYSVSNCSNFSLSGSTNPGGRCSFTLNGVPIDLPQNGSSLNIGSGNFIGFTSIGSVRHFVDGELIETVDKEFSFTGFSNDFVDSVAKDDERKCCICLENRSCCALNPCGHSEFCHFCIKKLVNDKVTSCPTCRQTFTGVCKVII